ncbi:MAG: DUF58 domain-containing protein [Legionellaceae bacterium]|nr:DUF58 domain-containing protein [Legionellaceae bacterium]
MSGLHVSVEELIALRRFAIKAQTQAKGKAQRHGRHPSLLRGRGMDFAEVRNYQAGDDIRHMEWRVTARTGKAHVKLYQEERERPVILLCDFNPSMFFGTRVAFKSVIAARLAALLAWTAAREGDRVGGLIFSGQGHEEYLPRGREYGVLPYLAGLSHYSQRQPADGAAVSVLSGVLLRSRRVMRPGSTLVIISDAYQLDADSERHLRRLRQHNLVLFYHICDPLELAPPPPAPYVLTNGQQELLLDNRQRAIQQRWVQECQQRQQQVEALCQRLMLQYTRVQSGDDLSLLVRQTFPRRRHGTV